MEEKYMNSIKAGVIGGIVMAVITVLSYFINFCGTGCIFGLLGYVVALATGVLALYFGPKLVAKIVDALVISAAAGGVAGLINGVVILLFAMLGVGSAAVSGSVVDAGIGIGAGIMGLVASVIVSVILAAIAGLIYAFAVLKVTA